MDIKGRRAIILVDFNQVVISNLFVQAKQYADQVEIDLVRSMVLTSLKRYRNKFRRTHGELVICVDAKGPWRKQVFPYYKENRKKAKEKSTIDWDVVMSTVYTIAAELYHNFPYKVISVDRAEADDAIAVITKAVHKSEPVVIISGDKDLVQLQKYPHVTQYDPIRDRFLSTDNPDRFLREHVLRGDTSDGVPNFMSDGDTFMNSEKRQKAIRQTKLDEWLDDPEFFEKSEFKENIERNRVLIDLDNIPEDIEEKILRQFAREPAGHRTKLMGYFAANRLSNLLECVGEF